MTVPSTTDLCNFAGILQAVRLDPIGAALNLYRYAKTHGAPAATNAPAQGGSL